MEIHVRSHEFYVLQYAQARPCVPVVCHVFSNTPECLTLSHLAVANQASPRTVRREVRVRLRPALVGGRRAYSQVVALQQIQRVLNEGYELVLMILGFCC